MTTSELDHWATWLAQRRHGGDPDELRRTLDRLAQVRDRVLDNAQIAPGDILLDVGTGDGLIARGALDRVGPEGSVLFSDISNDLLEQDRALVERLGVADRCRFVHAPAEDLAPVADASVDVVTTRSVLAYVPDKRRAFTEFARVLRSGGRLSIYEPINSLCYPEPVHRFFGYDVSPLQSIAARVNAVGDQHQPTGVEPMLDYDERDLQSYAGQVGFDERHLELRVDIQRHTPRRWETFVRSAPNPLAPTLEEAMAEALHSDEREQFVAHLRPLVERGDGTFMVAVAYLWATMR